LLLWIVAEIGKGQHDNRQARHNGRLGDRRNGRRARCRQIGDGFGAQRIDPHWPSDISHALFAQILESKGQLVADLVSHHPRDAESARLRERFQARCDIDAVTEDVVAVDDDVTEIDPDSEPDPVVLGHTGFAIDHRPLHLGGAADRVDDAREFRQHPVAGRLDDAAGMLADLRVDELAAMRL
jgi:hypothetical protein